MRSSVKLQCSWWATDLADQFVSVFIYLLLFFPAIPASAQEIEVRHFSVNDGLSGRRVRDLAFDHRGFLWIGVDNGLNRYDGHRFSVFNSNSRRSVHLGEGSITNCFFLPKEKELLLCYANNRFFERFNPVSGRVRRLPLNAKSGFRGTFRQASSASGNRLFFGASDTSHFLIQELRKGRFYLSDEIPLTEPVYSFFWSDSLILLTLSNTVMVVERNKGTRHYLLFQDVFGRKPSSSEGLNPSVVYRDRLGRLLLAFVNIPGLYHYQGGKRLKLVDDFPRQWFYSHLSRDSFDNELIFYKASLLDDHVEVRLSSGLGNKKLFTTQIDPIPYYVQVQGYRYDEEIWVPSYDGFLLLQPRKLKTYLEKPKGIRIIRGMVSFDARRLLIAVENSQWMLLDRQQDTCFPYLLKEELSGSPRPFGTCGKLVFDREGRLWGTNAQELIRIDTARRVYRSYKLDNPVEALDVDPQTGDIWLATWSRGKAGLFRFDPWKEQVFPYRDANGREPLQGRLSNDLYFSPHQAGIFWVATEKGIIRVDTRRRQSSELFGHLTGKADTIPTAPYVLTLRETPDGRLWAGTYGTGLWCIDPKKKEWRHWSRAQGLADDHVCSLELNRLGNIWIGTYNGLSFFQTQSQVFRNFSREDGLSHPEFNRFASCRTPEGRFYFGSMNGVNSFFQEDLLRPARHVDAPVLSQSIFWNSAKKDLDTLVFGSGRQPKVHLPAANRYLELHFALPHTFGAGNLQYTYLLEGLDEEWRPVGEHGKLVFQHLPSGNYRLLVRGATLQGAWSPSLVVTIVVEEFFYKKPIFYLFCLLAAVSIGYWWQRNRSRQSLKLANMRIDLAGDLHDEIGSSLIYLSQLVEQVKDADPSQRKVLLNYIQTTLQDSLSFIRDVVWAIDARHDRAENLLDRMEDFLYHMLSPAGIRYHFHREKAPLELSLAPLIRQHLYLLFREAITNIVKHSRATEVEVSFYLDRNSNWLHLYIQDNGRGIGPESGGGNGLESMKRRSLKLNGMLTLEPGPEGRGLSVHLQCPLRGRRKKMQHPA